MPRYHQLVRLKTVIVNSNNQEAYRTSLHCGDTSWDLSTQTPHIAHDK